MSEKPTLEAMGLDESSAVNQAAYSIAEDLYDSGHIPMFDISIILLVIQILQAIAPLIMEYCDEDGDEVARRAARLGPWQRLNWLATMAAVARREIGRRAFRRCGGWSLCNQLITKTAENKDHIVCRVFSEID